MTINFSIFGFTVTIRKTGAKSRAADLPTIDTSKRDAALAEIESQFDLTAIKERAAKMRAEFNAA